MSVLDDIKNSVSGSDNQKSGSSSNRKNRGGNMGRGSSTRSDDDFGGSIGSANDPDSMGSGQGGLGDQNTRGSQSSQSGRMDQSSRRSSGSSASNDFPNPQAGRPQQGSDSPQLSSNTRKKMENAGLNPNNGGRQRSGNDSASRNQGSNSRGRSQSSQSQGGVTRNDIEDLKAQNQQMIEILKRINQSLQR